MVVVVMAVAVLAAAAVVVVVEWEDCRQVEVLEVTAVAVGWKT